MESENTVELDLNFPELCILMADCCLLLDYSRVKSSSNKTDNRMTSDKWGAALLADIFVKKGLEHIVISPGSRNAPLVLSFTRNPRINAISIVDERSAAFFALGMAQWTKKTVAISCTSGGAVLNYAPAIAEAYYQKVPLLVITADRPKELIDQGDGQTIRQTNVYANYVKASFEIPGEISNEEEFRHVGQIINKAIDLTLSPGYGPVHINIPFAEPIYNQAEQIPFTVDVTDHPGSTVQMPAQQLEKLAALWNRAGKKLLIAGMMDPDPALGALLKKVADDPSVVLLTETTSNLMKDCSCPCIDRVVYTIGEEEAESFRPDLLVTFGGNVVSKMVKAFLRKYKPADHWNIDRVDYRMSTYQCLTEGIQTDPLSFFEQLAPHIEKLPGNYRDLWSERDARSEVRHGEFLDRCEYSDLKVFEKLLVSIPDKSNLHMGNSTPVRYVQLFRQKGDFVYHSNRGTSGIDGTVSTAAGAASVNGRPTTLVTGDLGFFYDSNALMNHHLNGNLRIIIINNRGGGIFRFIKGPGETEQLEEFFEAHHNWTAEHIARNFSIPYYSACNLDELTETLPVFFAEQQDSRPAILEIHTPHKKNGRILKSYFNYLKE